MSSTVEEEDQAKEKGAATKDDANAEKENEVIEEGEDMDEEYEDEEPPGSVQKPPDGGSRAWAVLAASFIIAFCIYIIQTYCERSIVLEHEEHENRRLYDIRLASRVIALPFLGIAMTRFGYRAVGFISCAIVSVSLFPLAWISYETYPETFDTLYCLAGLGFTSLNLISIVPILEYFQKKRMVALFVYSLASLAPRVLFEVVLNDKEFNKELAFTIYQLVAVTASGIACSVLVPLTLDVDIGTKWTNRITGLKDLSLAKDSVFYLLLVFVFLFRLGKGFGDQSQFTYPVKYNLHEEAMILLMPLLGQLAGYIIAVCLRQKLESTLFLMNGIIVLLAAALTCTVVIPMGNTAISYWATTCFTVVGVAHGLAYMTANEVIPDIFSKQNTRVVCSMVMCIAELSNLAESLYSDVFEKSSVARFVHAGILILSAGVCAFVLRTGVIPRNTKTCKGDNEGAPSENNQETENTQDVVECVSSA